jgi:hypothetical protein
MHILFMMRFIVRMRQCNLAVIIAPILKFILIINIAALSIINNILLLSKMLLNLLGLLVSEAQTKLAKECEINKCPTTQEHVTQLSYLIL